MMENALFYSFAFTLVAAAVAVVAVRNPVHAILALVVCFFGAAGLFLLLGAEFLAFMLIIVYAGAVAVLFLFIVMMLDLRKDFGSATSPVTRWLVLGVGSVLLAELGLMAATWRSAPVLPGRSVPEAAADNIHALGHVLYTDYVLPFQVAGLILLVAMTGAVVLALCEHRRGRVQNVASQLARTPADVLELHKVKTGAGVQP